MNHLRAIIHAIHLYFKEHNISSPKILIGYDTRTGNSPTLDSNSYTYCIVHELMTKKIKFDFCDSYTATPIISWAVKTYDYNLGIILTASHNPPNYNGIKINDSTGAPACIEMTSWIEQAANDIFLKLNPIRNKKINLNTINRVDYTSAFLDHIKSLIKDTFQLPPIEFNQHYVIDPKCGVAISVWKLLTENATGTIEWHNDQPSSTFNNELPNPTSPATIQTLGAICKKQSCIGFSNDPDADRHIMIDEKGNFISPEKLMAIILQYCQLSSIPVQSVATTLANSTLVKTICNAFNIPIHETNIGFKYFTPFLKQAEATQNICFGVESSGGLSMSFHSYDKCGFLPILLIISIMNKRDMSLHELSQEIDGNFQSYFFLEDFIELNNQQINLLDLFSEHAIVERSFGSEIDSINKSDGVKITFTNQDWVLCRPSGTEPLIRIYAESTQESSAKMYIEQAKKLFQITI